MDRLKAALFGVFAAALTLVALSPAYLLAQAPGGLPSIGPGSAFNSTIENYIYSGPQLATANLTGCITGGSPTLVGNYYAMKVTAGTSAATTCTVTWPVTRSVAPQCLIQSETALQGATPIVVTVQNTTTLTWTYVSTASAVFDIVCFGPR